MALKEATTKLKFIYTTTSHTPVVVNCSGVNVAQGVAYIDFGLIEPETMVQVTNRLQAGEKVPEEVEATHLFRLAMSPLALLQLSRQLEEVLKKLDKIVEEEPK